MVERRLTWLAGIVLFWGAAILFKLVSLQVVHHRQYAGMARARQELVVEIPAPRGTIFDRMGAPLAMSVPTEAVHINPLKVPDLGVAADILGMVLRMDRADLYSRIKTAFDNHRGYFVVKKKASFDEAERLRRMGFDWIDIDSASERHYPKGQLAAHVLGGVDFEEKGNAGVEKTLDETLRGIPGRERLLTDVKRRGIDSQSSSEPRPGASITLTIDERLQFVAERELAAAVAARNARSGSVVVMNPSNGEILAMASYPTYDPNRPPVEGDDPEARANHAVSVPFEPGSVFKVITLSAALETTNLRPDTPINTHGGVLKLVGRTIHDAETGRFGILPMAMVLAHSSNVGAIEVGMRVGQENMYRYVRRFGFGQKTGIPLPGEARGRLRKIPEWGTTSLASISMGQEVSVTTLQLAQAAAVVANGGLLVKPRLVLKAGDRTVPVETPVRVLSPENAITMRQMMEGVVLYGTGKNARLEGYSVGGKTGSAQIFDFASKHYTHTYNGTFMGFAPLNNPAVVVVVTLNGTHGTLGFGGQAAAPAFKVVTTEALRVLDVPKDIPEALPPVQLAKQSVEPDNDVAIADLGSAAPNILEDPDEDDRSTPGAPQPAGPKVPDFKGKTMRAVLSEAAQKGLSVLPDGSGLARIQYPPAGAVLRQGERIRVRFAR